MFALSSWFLHRCVCGARRPNLRRPFLCRFHETAPDPPCGEPALTPTRPRRQLTQAAPASHTRQAPSKPRPPLLARWRAGRALGLAGRASPTGIALPGGCPQARRTMTVHLAPCTRSAAMAARQQRSQRWAVAWAVAVVVAASLGAPASAQKSPMVVGVKAAPGSTAPNCAATTSALWNVYVATGAGAANTLDSWLTF
jgi:hypothetical protein